MRARYYVPGVGRFASADTVVPDPANPQTYNRYSYTLNNPIRFTDPNGRCIPVEGDLDSQECLKELPRRPKWVWNLLPVENPEAIQWYGNTEFAFRYGKNHNYDDFAQGLHPGIDIILDVEPDERIPIVAGAYGEVVCVNTPGDCGAYGPGRVDISNNNMTLLYGHLSDIQVEEGDKVTPSTIIGYLDPIKDHVHIEILLQDEDGIYMVNPLPYFLPNRQVELLDVSLAMDEGSTLNTFYIPPSGTLQWQDPYDQPILRRMPGWIFPK